MHTQVGCSIARLVNQNRSSFFVWLVLLIWLLFLSRAQASEVKDFVGKEVAEITFLSDGIPINFDGLSELVETRVGFPLSIRQVRESITHLFSLGEYESINVTGTLLSGAVGLQYELVPIQLVTDINVRGDARFSSGELQRAVTDAHGRSFYVDQVQETHRTLQEFYRARGYLRADIEVFVERHGDKNVMVASINAGEQALIDRIVVRGLSSTMYERVLARLGFETGKHYDGTRVERRLRSYENQLRGQRYYEVNLEHSIEMVDGGSRVYLILDINHGRRIRVSFSGDDLPDDNLENLVPIEREGSVDEDLLEDIDTRITEHLHQLGYRDAEVSHSRKTDENELSIVFSLNLGRLYQLESIVFSGNFSVSESLLASFLQIQPGDPLVIARLNNSVDDVTEYYRQLGYAAARVEADIKEPSVESVTIDDGPDKVVYVLSVQEGSRTVIRSVDIDGNSFLSDEEVLNNISALEGDAYYARQIAEDSERLRRIYLDYGYEDFIVTAEPKFDEEFKVVDLVYHFYEGPQVLIDHILVVGNQKIDAATIESELTIREGQALSLSDVAQSRRNLNALGLFRQVDIREFSHGRNDRKDVVVVVEEAPSTRLGYGGGFEFSQRLRRETDPTTGTSRAVERLEFAPRGFIQIGRRNLWGKNRSIDLFTRVSVRRKNNPIDLIETSEQEGFGFNEYRILSTYTEPRVFGSTWNLYVTAFVEEAIRPGFDLFSRGFNAEARQQFTSTVSGSLIYGWGKNDTANIQLNPEDVPLVDRLFEKVRLSAFSGSIVRDTRTDLIDPSDGEVLSVDAKLAGRSIGSEVGFVKTYMQAFLYRALPGFSDVVLATGARLGLAARFEQSSLDFLPAGDISQIEGGAVLFQNRLLPISERFFAGGDTTVRGFAFDRLGIPLGERGSTIGPDGFPRGGNAVLVLNTEVRFPLTQNFGLVGFLDAGNVYDTVRNFSLARIRAGAGFGVRYRSPVGPIRVDLGFKLNRQELVMGVENKREPLTALHISIGQAF